MNIDPAEIAKFDALASRWWDINGEMKPLHEINPLRMQFIEQNIKVFGLNVLDIGCGGGILSESLALRGAKVTAIDMAEASIQVAKLHQQASDLSIDYQVTTAEDFAKNHSGQFDVVTCLELLEHVPDPLSVIQACATLLKPKGKLFLSTLNRNVKSYLFAIVGAEYVLRMLPKGTHDYKKFIRPSELENWMRQAGLSMSTMIGLHYNPLTKIYKLGPDVSVNYMVCGQKS